MKLRNLFAALLLCGVTSYAQSIKLGGELGLASPQEDFGGTTIEYYNGINYGLKSGYNVGLIAKLGLGGIGFRGIINFVSLSNSGIAASDKPNSNVELNTGIMSIGIGPEYSIAIPASPITPHIGADILFNNISGDVTFQGISDVPSGKFTMESASRIGLGFGAGVEYKLGLFSLDLNIRYNLYNLTGKEFVDLITSDKRIDSYLNLNDEKDPVTSVNKEHFVTSTRSISGMQINIGILFGL